MTQTLAPPASRAAHAREVVSHRVTLRGVSWKLYDQLVSLVGDGSTRMTYDRGILEIEMPSEQHESLKWIAGRFIEAFAEERGIDYRAVGSTTWRRKSIDGGLEADESYYIQNHHLVAGRPIDPAIDPPPDVAVEIDLSPPEVEKASIYTRLGVPEIWRWRDDRLTVLLRQATGDYQEAARSLALPSFPLAELARALESYPAADAARLVAAFRRWVRENAAQS